MIIPLGNMFITVQQIQAIRMFSFQRNFSFGAVHSADEKHLSADAIAAGIVARSSLAP